MTDIERQLKEIETLAPTVGTAYDEATSAITAEVDAEARVLERAVELARPALKALSSRVRVGYRSWWIGSTHTDHATTHHPTLRGMFCTENEGPAKTNPGRDENRGAYGGKGLLLGADGQFYALKYSGHWSRWQGEGDEWEAEVSPVSAAQVVAHYRLSSLLACIHEALVKQAEAKRPTKTASERAEKLDALVKLSR